MPQKQKITPKNSFTSFSFTSMKFLSLIFISRFSRISKILMMRFSFCSFGIVSLFVFANCLLAMLPLQSWSNLETQLRSQSSKLRIIEIWLLYWKTSFKMKLKSLNGVILYVSVNRFGIFNSASVPRSNRF